MTEIKNKQQLERIENIIILILEEKEGYIQVDDLKVGDYYFAIPRSRIIDRTSLYIGKVQRKLVDDNYFEDMHNPVTNEKFEDAYHSGDNFIFARIEYDHFSFINKYKMFK